jgi:hypothetical protein
MAEYENWMNEREEAHQEKMREGLPPEFRRRK